MVEAPSFLKKKIIFKKFKLVKLLNTSAFSWVYEGRNLLQNIPVAMKLAKADKFNFLDTEAYILMSVKGIGIPRIISYGRHGPFKILIEEFLGKDLQIIWSSCPFKNDPLGVNNTYLKDICLLAIQGIERLKHIHNRNVIHRDIKTKNFLIGRNDPNIIYLIDFGFSRQYRSSRTGKHIRFSNIKVLIGSLFFSSHNAIRGYESSRRDDLESFGYMLLYLARGGWIPWMKYNKIKDKNEALQKILKIKLKVTDENLCKGLPNEFIQYMKYVKKLDFEQEPDYQYLIGLFISILSKKEMIKNVTFFWIKRKPRKKDKKNTEAKEIMTSISLPKSLSRNNSRTNSLKKLYCKIKESLSKNSLTKNKSEIYYRVKDTKNINSDSKINSFIPSFNINRNNIPINLPPNTNNNRAKTGKICLTK